MEDNRKYYYIKLQDTEDERERNYKKRIEEEKEKLAGQMEDKCPDNFGTLEDKRTPEIEIEKEKEIDIEIDIEIEKHKKLPPPPYEKTKDQCTKMDKSFDQAKGVEAISKEYLKVINGTMISLEGAGYG